MSLEAHLENRSVEPDRRNGERRRLQLQVDGATGDGAPLNVTILDLSQSGFLLRTTAELAVDEVLEVELPLAGAQAARVVWASNELFGCRFDAPISKAAVSAAQLQAAPRPTPSRRDAGVESETFGARLRRLRKARDLSLVGLARALGVTKPTIWYWENDQARPRSKSLSALASVLDVPLEELVPAEWVADVTGTLPAPGPGLDEVVQSCRQRIAEAAGTTPDRVQISLRL